MTLSEALLRSPDAPVACPSCQAILTMDGSHAVVCTRCGRRYPFDAESAIVDFLPGMSDSRPLTEYADCWDDEALQDEIAAATAAPKDVSSGIFIKMPPLLSGLDFDD